MKNANSPQFATVYIIGGSGLKAPENSRNLAKKKKKSLVPVCCTGESVSYRDIIIRRTKLFFFRPVASIPTFAG